VCFVGNDDELLVIGVIPPFQIDGSEQFRKILQENGQVERITLFYSGLADRFCAEEQGSALCQGVFRKKLVDHLAGGIIIGDKETVEEFGAGTVFGCKDTDGDVFGFFSHGAKFGMLKNEDTQLGTERF